MNTMEFELTAQSEAFEDFNAHLNHRIKKCLYELYEGNFEGGEISAKISIELCDSTQEVYVQNESGEEETTTKYFRTPQIESKVTLTLKKRTEAKATFSKKTLELKFDKESGRFTLAEIPQMQMKLTDIEEEVDAFGRLPESERNASISNAEHGAVADLVDSLGTVGK
ncbi:MAG: hypothetical protein FWB91_02080 [Defluviitaleaceae bacterium]|nr:hypothetical protein [Defluviitaleaceae bacterium]